MLTFMLRNILRTTVTVGNLSKSSYFASNLGKFSVLKIASPGVISPLSSWGSDSGQNSATKAMKHLEGFYINELGSVMEITEAKDGYIKGCYGSSVGTKDTYPLVGQYDKVRGNAIGWVVSYQAQDSTCGWSGQVFQNKGGKICIHTTWLLSQTSTEQGLWHSTNVGVDVFENVNHEDLANYKLPEHPHPRQSNIPKNA